MSDQNGLQYTSEDWHEYAAEKTSLWVFTEGNKSMVGAHLKLVFTSDGVRV